MVYTVLITYEESCNKFSKFKYKNKSFYEFKTRYKIEVSSKFLRF